MDLARSAADEPTSSRMFCAACPRVWEPGRPETELAAPRTINWLRKTVEEGRAIDVGFRRRLRVGEWGKWRRNVMGVRRMAEDNMMEGRNVLA